jgi:hypothetical protein
VARRSLSAQTEGPATVALPAAGRVLRQGAGLYRVNAVPVILLYGRVPAWRTLSEGMTGADVTQLNTGLVALGYGSTALLGPRAGWDLFSAGTGDRVRRLSARSPTPMADADAARTRLLEAAEPDPACFAGAHLDVRDLVGRNHELAALLVLHDEDGAFGNGGVERTLDLRGGRTGLHDELTDY